MPALTLDPDRLFPLDPAARRVARDLYERIRALPIFSPHGHTDPRWFAQDEAFNDATELLLWPDHYVFRMLQSQGISLEQLGIAADGDARERSVDERRAAWRLFAEHFYLFRGTPSALWLNHVFHDVFGLRQRLDPDSADLYFDRIGELLATPEFRPRALLDRFGIEVIATTEGALDPLEQHAALPDALRGRVITTFRPDDITDPDRTDFCANLDRLEAITGEDCATWNGLLQAIAARRAFFRTHGATATDHGHRTARTADLEPPRCQSLLDRVRGGRAEPGDAELFRAQMLTEMARQSCDDGMVMQIHPGVWRDHDRALHASYGPNRGADIPVAGEFVAALKPMLDAVGGHPRLSVILFTLDETTYARELAPLAGHYHCLKLGPAWWFNDSPEGMLRFRRQTTETAGFYNTVGFNDDTRAFLSIPARHDVARRVDCAFLAELVCTGRLDRDEAESVAADLAYHLPRQAYRLDRA